MKGRNCKRLVLVLKRHGGTLRETAVPERSRAAAVFRTGLCIGVLCLLPLLRADAAPVYSEDTRKASIEDDADLLTPGEEEELLSEAAALSGQSGYEIRLVTTDDTGGLTTRQYAEQSFEKLTEDPPGKASGASYVIDMDNRNLYVATYGQLQYYLTDSRVESLLDDAYEPVSEQDYSGTFRSMLKDTARWYREGIKDGTRIYDEDTGTYTVYHRPRVITAWKVIAALLASAGTFFAVSLSVTGSYSMRRRSGDIYRTADHVHLSLTGQTDRVVNHFVTSTRIPRNSGGGGGSSGGISTTHTTSGGYSSGGGGRSF